MGTSLLGGEIAWLDDLDGKNISLNFPFEAPLSWGYTRCLDLQELAVRAED